MNELMILLPKQLDILCNKKSSDIDFDREEYSVYFKNIIYPYSEEYDIVIDCQYGKNLGHCWRIDSFPDEIDGFPLTLKVYAPFGKLLAVKTTYVKLLRKKNYEKTTLLCIGDSMTRGEVYINQVAVKLSNIATLGTKSIRLNVNHEGRGGWKSSDYLNEYFEEGKGVSPFLFPKMIKGKEYFGDKTFFERLEDAEYRNGYFYCGSRAEKISDEMFCSIDGKLYQYRNEEYHLIDEKPVYEFDFIKYLERNTIEKPDVVSLLFGANDVQTTSYEDAEQAVEMFISNMKKIISAIRRAGENIKIVVAMPVCGAKQYAWGKQLGCSGSSKRYEYLIKLVGQALLNEFDGKRQDGIYICPMLAVCDPDVGFSTDTVNANLYSDVKREYHNNWVHPNESGYRQMGDALAGTITAIRTEN